MDKQLGRNKFSVKKEMTQATAWVAIRSYFTCNHAAFVSFLY